MEEQSSDFSSLPNSLQQEEEILTPPPLPVIREKLYDFSDEYDENTFDDLEIWESGENTNSSLISLYCSPLELMFQGSFPTAKIEATAQDKWLIVNLQSSKELNSHLLNRDLWTNVTVAETIKSNFLFWQAHDDTEEGRKVCSFYNLDSFPVILVIDPITGEKMRCFKGMVEPDRLLMDLLPSFMENGPKYYLKHPFRTEKSCETQEEEEKKKKKKEDNEKPCEPIEEKMQEMVNPPPLPEEQTSFRCRVAVRVPDGRRYIRNFHSQDSIQLLWSFCYSKIEETKRRDFLLLVAIPGNSTRLDFDSGLSFEKSGLSNALISLVWKNMYSV